MLEKYIKDLTRGLFKEYEEKAGAVTCEFSLDRKQVGELFDFIQENKLIYPGSKWVANECETCQKHHGAQYVHIQIETEDYIEKYVDNIIRLSK